jgi:hypothetical protein
MTSISNLAKAALTLLLLVVPHSLRAADPPGIINHQGRIAVSGVNHDGPGYFKFALVNATGNITYWSNDATSIAGAAPTAAIETPVTGGHYSVPLGDTGYHTKMTNAIPKEIFAENADVRLAIWFSANNTTFQKLSPNRRLASSAYALSSGSAGAIASDSVGSEQIATGAINSTHLAADSVSADQIADGAVTTATLANGAVTGDKIADSTIMGTHLAPGSVTANTLANGAVGSAKIAMAAINGTHLAHDSVSANHLSNGAVTTAAIADDAVTGDKIADGAVTAMHLAPGAFSTDSLANNSIGSAKIATGAVNGTHLANGSVSGAQIAGAAVTTAALADEAVTGDKIADGTVMGVHLANGAVSTDTLANGAVTGTKIANGTIMGVHLANGAITTVTLADNAVTADKIADGAVSTDTLANNSVTSAKIADGSVTKADLHAGIGVWDSAAGNVYRSSGRVGIGTADPLGLFEIHGDAVTGAETLDQEVLTPDTTAVVSWQSFTTGLTGKLTRIALKVRSPLGANSSPGTINLFSGEGVDGNLLRTQSVTFENVAAETYQTFVLTNPIDVTVGEVYTIGIVVAESLVNWMYVDTSNPYPGGRSSVSTRDLGFRTHVTPFSSTAILTVRDGNLGLGIPSPTSRLHVVGGALFTSGAGGANQSVSWSPGEASWSFTSDRNTKEGILPVDPETVLEKLAGIPIAEWNYIGYDQRHIGPMAQDFHAAFPLNESDTSLNNADLHGVALAAIQGLNRKLETRDESLAREKAALREENESLKKRLEILEEQVGRLLQP